MLKFIKKFNRNSGIISIFVMLVLIPSITFLSVYYRRSTQIIRDDFVDVLLQSLYQADANISEKLEKISDLSNMLFMNKYLYSAISENGTKTVSEHIYEEQELQKIISGVQSSRNVYKVKLYVDDKKIYAREKVNFFPMSELDDNSWYKTVRESNGRIVWLDTSKQKYIDKEDEAYVVSCVRVLKNPVNYSEPMGVLKIDIDERDVFNVLSNISTKYQDNVYIVNCDGIILSHFDKSKIGLQAEAIASCDNLENEGVFTFGMNGAKSYVIYMTMQLTGWRIVHEVNAGAMADNMLYNISSYTILTLYIFFMVVIAVIVYFTKTTRRRIKEIVDEIDRQGIEKVKDNLPQRGSDITRLKESIDGMLVTISKMAMESYHSKIREREAQLHALQAQINPHFLYNTLDAINWMAININALDISFMIESLAHYFRLSLSKGRNIVSIGDEIELSKVYLEIQRKRFSDSFTLELEIDNCTEEYTIPKLSLQPIVENALLHGIQKRKDNEGVIKISAHKSGSDIIISVKDNGLGMTNKEANRLLENKEHFEENNKKKSGYGLYNVNERIKLFSGGTDDYGLKIYSEKSVGTCVEIILKAQKGSAFIDKVD
ncbi:MAG: sensor histidine kinase [Firmicutes bacterium]|nr:sensor histidine kinase [Bacillota bacterium]